VLSAGINSLTTVTCVDFYQRLFHRDANDARLVLVGRLGTIGWGLTATVGALFVGRLGSVVNAFNLINSLLGGPILGIFLLGMLTRRAKGTGAVVGAAVGLLSVMLLQFKSPLSFYYFALIGSVVSFGIGYLVSMIGPAPDQEKLRGLVQGLDFREVNEDVR